MALSAGSEIDAWCTSCRMTLNHKIVAMVGGTPKRVLCLTCNKQHNYRPPKAPGAGAATPVKAARNGKKPAAHSSSGARAPSASREWQANVAERSAADFVPYSIHTTYTPGQLVTHPKFGSGFVKETLDSQKLCILFKDGPKTLVHGR